MSQSQRTDLSHQVPRVGGTYDATSPQVGGNAITITANTTLKVFQQNVHAVGTPQITLPPVGEAIGRIYIISSEGAATVVDQDDAYGWADVTMAATEVWLFTSNGRAWHQSKGEETT